ncbi:RPA-related protein RADX, partial [Varanus komodoensis]
LRGTLARVLASDRLRAALPDAPPVSVLRLERYGADVPPPGAAPRPPAAPCPCYYYDVTVTDGVCQEKCHLAPELNPLVHKSALRCGLRVRITQCSYMYNEKRLGDGFLCIEGLEILGVSDLGEAPPAPKPGREKPAVPLRGGKRHYLPLWNNEDPYGEIWVEKKVAQDVCVDESKLGTLLQLDMGWKSKINFQPLLVRILHKARLRYYGKPDTKLDMPYQ